MIYKKIEDAIGNTPLLRIDAEYYGIHNVDLYVKLEYLNPFGSIKDRTVYGMLPDDTLARLQSSGTELIESSSGNTAKAMQMLANKYDITFTSVTNRIKVPEVEQLLRYLGTNIVALPGRSECADPNNADDSIGVICRMMRENPDKYHHTSQYTNLDNTLAHEETTAAEIYDELGTVDAVVISVGTGGSSGGFINYAKHNHKSTVHVGIVAHPNDFIPGIRTYNELFETDLFNRDDFDELNEVSSKQSLEVLREFVCHDGIMAGPTTGANLAGLLEYARRNDTRRSNGSRKVMVTVACDRLETYMSYIAKRQPELFDLKNENDIFDVLPTPEEIRSIEKPANRTTTDWINGEQAIVIDTRGVKPYSQFHIDGSLNFPEEHLREILIHGSPFPTNKPLLFVCPRGDRSQLLATTMARRGFKSYSLAGGLMAWRSNGLPFTRKNA